MNLSQIYQDKSLHGHALMSLPHTIWNFSKGKFCLSGRPDPGTLVVYRTGTFMENIHYRSGSSTVYCSRIRFIGKPIEDLIWLPVDLIELIGRRVLGSCAAAASFLVFPPIVFIAKIIHFSARQINAYVASIALSQKIGQIWYNADLVGHALTTAPTKCYQFATAPLGWHLSANGRDRRVSITAFDEGGSLLFQQKREFTLVPFELFEVIYRGFVGGALVLASSAASPIGLLSKSVHLAGWSIFSR